MSSRWPNHIRIIGGTWKNKRINLSSNSLVRPTPIRARQVLFNWLNFEMPGKHVLDLFAGSGVLGLEALSRGAASVVFVEKDRLAYSRLKENCFQLNLESDQARVVRANALNWLPRQESPWDLVFLDPPFERLHWYSKCLTELLTRMNTNGLIYVERNKRAKIDTSAYQTLKSRDIGEVRIELLTPQLTLI